MGEAGTLAGASSLASAPNIIYAGGQNNGVSSGIIKTTDGGRHWERKSHGLWDTRILGVWIHPDDPTANHVFTGCALPRHHTPSQSPSPPPFPTRRLASQDTLGNLRVDRRRGDLAAPRGDRKLWQCDELPGGGYQG